MLARLTTIGLLGVVLFLFCGSDAMAAANSWDAPQIRDVIRNGLFHGTAARFAPQSPIRAGALAGALQVVNVDQNGLPGCSSGPTISGTVQDGQMLIVSKGSWIGNPTSFSYQWQTSPDRTTWSDLVDATSSSYTVQTPDVGNYLRVEVIASNDQGSSPAAYSAATVQVLPAGAIATPTTTPPTTCPATPVPTPTYRPKNRSAKVTNRVLDNVLVHYLGLDGAAGQLRATLTNSGLKPPPWAGTESIARILGLQVTLRRDQQHLETQLRRPATRAQAAYALDQVLHFSDSPRQYIQSVVAALTPIPIDPWQRRILNVAMRFIGTPYIWGGNSERGPQYLFGQRLPGGFDCSGFVRRVYVLQHYPHSNGLNNVLHGRTTYEMSAVPRSARIYKQRNLEPGDVMFFGKGPRSSPSQVDHTGIYVGNGWLIDSSGNGVTLAPFSGWFQSSFAWAERPLRAAALSR